MLSSLILQGINYSVLVSSLKYLPLEMLKSTKTRSCGKTFQDQGHITEV